MTHSENDLSEVINTVIVNFFTFFGLLIAGIVFLITVATPLAWFLEMEWPGEGYPIFIDWKTWQDESVPKWQKIVNDLYITFYWVAYTIMGTKTGYPSGPYTAYIHGFLKLMGIAIIVISTATLSNVFDVSTKTTSIESFGDLHGTTVCTVAGTTSESLLNSTTSGIAIVRRDSIAEMFDAFWSFGCKSVVYDFPILQNELKRRAEQGSSSKAVLVGELLTEERYGIAMKEQSPNNEKIVGSTLDVLANRNFMSLLRDKYISDIDGVGESSNVDVPVALIVVPCVSGVILLALAVFYLYNHYDDRKEEYVRIREGEMDLNYGDNLERVYQQQKNSDQYILWNDDRISDQILLPGSLWAQRLLLELALLRQGKDPRKYGKGILPSRDIVSEHSVGEDGGVDPTEEEKHDHVSQASDHSELDVPDIQIDTYSSQAEDLDTHDRGDRKDNAELRKRPLYRSSGSAQSSGDEQGHVSPSGVPPSSSNDALEK